MCRPFERLFFQVASMGPGGQVVVERVDVVPDGRILLVVRGQKPGQSNLDGVQIDATLRLFRPGMLFYPDKNRVRR